MAPAQKLRIIEILAGLEWASYDILGHSSLRKNFYLNTNAFENTLVSYRQRHPYDVLPSGRRQSGR